MGITIIKFHPFEGLVRRIESEFHGDSRYTTPMARNEHGKMSNLYMGITIVKFHPFEGLVRRIEPEFHGDSRYATPMV